MTPQLVSMNYLVRYEGGLLLLFTDTFDGFDLELREYDPDPSTDPKPMRKVSFTYMMSVMNYARNRGIQHSVFEEWQRA